MAYKQKSLEANMALNAIKGIMSLLFPLISFPYASRVLGVNNMGRYNFANSVISYFVLLAGLGISTYAIREGARVRDDKNEINKLANELFSINIVSTIISYAVLILLVFLVTKFYEYRGLLLILSFQVVFKTIGIEWIYSIYEDYLYITIRSIIFQLLSIIALFLFVKKASDLNLYALITVTASGGSNIINYFHARKYCRVSFTFKIDWKRHIKPIIILFAMSATTTIYVSSDTTILGFLSGDYFVGIYSVSTKVYSIVKSLLSAILTVSIPRLSMLLGEKDLHQFNSVASSIFKTLLTFMIPSMLGIILLRNEIIFLISGAEYSSAQSSLTILAVALVACLGAWFWGQCILVPYKEETFILKVTVASALINIVLNLLLIPRFNENAAAFTTVVSEALSYFCLWIKGRKYCKLEGVFPFLVKVALGCVGIVFICFALNPIKKLMIIYTVLCVILSIIIYFIIECIVKNECFSNIIKNIHIKEKPIK